MYVCMCVTIRDRDEENVQCIRLSEDVCSSGNPQWQISHPFFDFLEQGSRAQKCGLGLPKAELMKVSLGYAAHHSPAWLVFGWWCWRSKRTRWRGGEKREKSMNFKKKYERDWKVVKRQWRKTSGVREETRIIII